MDMQSRMRLRPESHPAGSSSFDLGTSSSAPRIPTETREASGAAERFAIDPQSRPQPFCKPGTEKPQRNLVQARNLAKAGRFTLQVCEGGANGLGAGGSPTLAKLGGPAIPRFRLNPSFRP